MSKMFVLRKIQQTYIKFYRCRVPNNCYTWIARVFYTFETLSHTIRKPKS